MTVTDRPYTALRRRYFEERNALIVTAIEKAGGCRAQAAHDIGMERSAMLRIVREHGLPVPPTRNGRPPRRDKE